MQNPVSTDNAIEIKAAWRPLTAAEKASKTFLTSRVRYYETNSAGKPCYQEDVWGMISMHVISFTPGAPWGVWSTWEHSDALLTKDGKPVETATGALTGNLPSGATPVEPMLTSDPNAAQSVVTFKDQSDDYCTDPGSRMFFRENPHYAIKVTVGNKVFRFPTLPSGGKICVNSRWRAIPDPIVKLNETAQSMIKAELKKNGITGDSPWLHYRLTNMQSQPVDYDIRDQASQAGAIVNGAYGPYVTSSEEAYFMADAVIETDYSLGNFTGDLVEGVPVNKVVEGDQLVDYYNNILLKFQSNGFASLSDKMRMGGCLGCHGFASKIGQNFSFALGSNAKAPDPVDAFAAQSVGLIDYFTEPRARFMQSR